nr:hypothetical protein [Bacillaceae bacterium JMAK1]
MSIVDKRIFINNAHFQTQEFFYELYVLDTGVMRNMSHW